MNSYENLDRRSEDRGTLHVPARQPRFERLSPQTPVCIAAPREDDFICEWSVTDASKSEREGPATAAA